MEHEENLLDEMRLYTHDEILRF